jgi:hypothetical protein
MTVVVPVTSAEAQDNKALDLMKFYWHCYVLMWTDPPRQFAECGKSFPHLWTMTGPGQNGPAGSWEPSPPPPPPPPPDCRVYGYLTPPRGDGQHLPAYVAAAAYGTAPGVVLVGQVDDCDDDGGNPPPDNCPSPATFFIAPRDDAGLPVGDCTDGQAGA